MKVLLVICNQILSGSINGVYQGVLLAGLIVLGLRVTGRTNAATRHAILFFTMLLLVALMLPHWAGPSFHVHRPATMELLDGANKKLSVEEVVSDASVFQEEREFSHNIVQVPDLEIAELALNDSKAEVSSSGSELGLQTSAAVRPTGVPLLENLRGLRNHLLNPFGVAVPVPKHVGIFLVIACVAVTVIKLFVLLFRLAQIRNLKLNSQPPGDELSDILQQFKQGAGRNVTLRISRSIKAPLLLGFIRPMILLPAEFVEEATQSDIQQVLRHELAHLERYDDWANLIQHFIQAFFFFHPGVWWVSRGLSLDREIACDDHVLEQSGRRAYALLLANLAGRMRGYPSLAPGTSGNKNQLKQRIDMVLDSCRNNSPRVARTRVGLMTTAAALLAAAAICYAPRVAVAQNEPTQSPADPPAPAERGPRDESGPFIPPPRPGLPPGARMRHGDLPMLAGQQQPPGTPRVPVAPMPPGFSPGEHPLEERLARLEKMVQMLMSRLDMNSREGDLHGKARMEEEAMREQIIGRKDREGSLWLGTKDEGAIPYPRSNSSNSRGRQIIMGKLDRIRLDKGWDGLPLSEVIKDLGNESRKRDPDKRGINFIINPNTPTPARAIDPTTGVPFASGAPAEPVDIGATLIKINPVLTDVSLADLLEAIVKVADRPIKYSIEDYAVVFSVKSAQDIPMGFGRRLRDQDRNKLMEQVEMLEREKQKLGQQIEKLQKEQEKLEQSSKEKPENR
jgi:beta-lactamase regulating signal transducer with metallopeptidase domain